LGPKEEFLELLKKDEEFRYTVAGFLGLEEILKRLDKHEQRLTELREDMNAGFKRHDEEIAKLREDMNRGFALVERHIAALGARWGMLAEEAFREGLRGIVEKEFGLKIERWTGYDEEGKVFGYPSSVEIDVALHDEKIMLIEVKSNVNASDIFEFKRKAELYEEKFGKKPVRKIIVTPNADERAIEAARKLDIEI
jgi:hypothetical protein